MKTLLFLPLITCTIMTAYSQQSGRQIIDIKQIKTLTLKNLPSVDLVNSDKDVIEIIGETDAVQKVKINAGTPDEMAISCQEDLRKNSDLKITVYTNQLKRLNATGIAWLKFSDCMDDTQAAVNFSAIDKLLLGRSKKGTKLSVTAIGLLLTQDREGNFNNHYGSVGSGDNFSNSAQPTISDKMKPSMNISSKND